ncbi:MAG: hypothetical protein WCC48_17155 [Anaeromyxobacteraceae bacterium]
MLRFGGRWYWSVRLVSRRRRPSRSRSAASRRALARRVDRARQAAGEAEAKVAAVEREAIHASLAVLDAQISEADRKLTARALEVGAELAASANRLKELVARANALAAKLPVRKPSSNEALGLGPDDRGSSWFNAPMPGAAASPASALLVASGVASNGRGT